MNGLRQSLRNELRTIETKMILTMKKNQNRPMKQNNCTHRFSLLKYPLYNGLVKELHLSKSIKKRCHNYYGLDINIYAKILGGNG